MVSRASRMHSSDCGRTRPDAGKRLAMDRQVRRAGGPPIGTEVEIGQARIAANGQGRVVRRRKPKAGLVQPVGDQDFEMLDAAHALHVSLRGQRRMPGENFEAVEPPVLDHQQPSDVAKAVNAANAARCAFCEGVIHRPPFRPCSSADRGASEVVRAGPLADGDGQHP